MADEKISAMTDIVTPLGSDFIPLVRNGDTTNYYTTPTELKTFVGATSPGGSAGQIQFNNSGAFGGFTASGDATINTSTGTITFATVNANVGTFQGITVNAKGLVTAAADQHYITGNQTITLSGDASGSGTTAISVTNSKFNGGTAFGSMAGQAAGSVSITGGTITGMPTPSASTDVANKSYVDATVAGLQIKPTATVATTAALPTNTYNNGASGVGATITIVATGTLTVDSHVVALNDLVLVKNEATAANNGLYLVTTAGAIGVAAILTRSVDMNTASEFSGALIPVSNIGTTNANSLWLANPSTPVVVGTTAIPFTQLNGATDITANAPLSISGNTISVSNATTAALGVIIAGANTTINAGGTLSVAAPGTGTLTSINAASSGIYSFTGGPITTAGTLTLVATGTSGGIPYFSGTTTLSTSALLTANAIILGGGAGTAPATLGSLGTTTTVLHGNAAGAPSFGAVVLTSDVSGALPVGNGGLGIASGTSGGILGFTGTATIASSALLAAHGVMLGGGAGATPTAISSLGATGQVLTSQGASADPIYASRTITTGYAVDIATAIPAGTYDCGVFVQGGTVLNSYGHVASGGTITTTGAIGQTGTYTSITGLASIAASSTVDTVGTATSAQTIAAGSHLWAIVAITGVPLGGSIMFSVRVP